MRLFRLLAPAVKVAAPAQPHACAARWCVILSALCRRAFVEMLLEMERVSSAVLVEITCPSVSCLLQPPAGAERWTCSLFCITNTFIPRKPPQLELRNNNPFHVGLVCLHRSLMTAPPVGVTCSLFDWWLAACQLPLPRGPGAHLLSRGPRQFSLWWLYKSVLVSHRCSSSIFKRLSHVYSSIFLIDNLIIIENFRRLRREYPRICLMDAQLPAMISMRKDWDEHQNSMLMFKKKTTKALKKKNKTKQLMDV